MLDNALILIPARMQSSRFPGKPLAEIAGRPLLAWTVDAASLVAGRQAVTVLTEEADTDIIEKRVTRTTGLLNVVRDISLSREACEMFTRAMNVVVLPILARQRAAQQVPDDTLPNPPHVA